MIGERVLRPALVGVPRRGPNRRLPRLRRRLLPKEPAEELADEHVETSAKDNTGEPAPDIEDEPDILDIPNPLRSPNLDPPNTAATPPKS